MTNSSSNRMSRTSDSSTQNASITATRTATPAIQPKASRFGTKARQFLDALMRSLAAPHI
jgi:hypothetical protein